MLALLTMTSGWASAESVTFNVRSWDSTNKKVVTTSTTHDCTPIEGQNWSWMALGEKDKETYYVVKGTDVTRKVLVIFGTVHLVLTDNCKLTCNHVKLEANNNAVLHVHDQGSTSPGTLNAINYSPDGKREYKNAAAIGSGGGEDNNSGSLYVHGGNIVAEQVRTIEGIFSTGSNAAAIGGGKYGGIDPNHRVVVYDGSVNAQGGYEGAGIGGGYKGHQGGPVIIYGGRVEAKTSVRGAGIGGGCDRNGGRVEIYGGTVIARSNRRSAGIGGGEDGHGGDVHIYGGDVKAYGSTRGAGIGGSGEGNGGTCEIAGGTVYAKSGRDEDVRYVCPAIGGGSKGNGGTVKITGGTVIVENDWIIKNKAPLALIGGSLNLNPGSVEIAPGMKVSCNKNQGQLTLVNSADKRVKALRNESNVYGRIEPCNHQGTEATYKQVDDNQHSVVCKVCGYEGKENHKYTDGKCACGKEEKKEPAVYTITIHKTTDGKAYTSEEQKVVKGKEFMLPVPEAQSGLTFMGYLKAASADGIEMKDSEEDALLEGGSTISPDADATYYARYRYIYDEEWTWNDELTEASVKITNALLNDTQTLKATITEDTDQRVEPTETTPGERYFTAAAYYTHGTGITYPFYDYASQTFFSDTNPKITLDVQSKDYANTEKLSSYLDMNADVTINNLTLKKDGKIHPICLPFYVSKNEDTPFKGAIIYELSGISLYNHVFTMRFVHTTGVKPGVPCFYRFTETGTDVQNPVFKDVLIEEISGLVAEKKYTPNLWSVDDETLELWGSFEPEAIDEVNRELFFVMDGDGISLKPETLPAFGSYFYIASPLDEQGNNRIRSVSLVFADDDIYTFSKKLTYSWDGDGSEALPYIISSAEQLYEMQEAMNGTEGAELEGKYFRQGANITLDKTVSNNFTPVKTFKGHYDGAGYTISGLNIDLSKDNLSRAALFGTLEGSATVKNVIVQNSTIIGASAAAVAGYVSGTSRVENCHALKDVVIDAAYWYAGGIVAYTNDGTPTIASCTSQASVHTFDNYAGGVIGRHDNGSATGCIYLGNSITHTKGTSYAHAVIGGGGHWPTDCYFTDPTLTDNQAKLMPDKTVDNTDFLTRLAARDKFLTGTSGLTAEQIGYDITLNNRTTLAAVQNADGTWQSKAFSVCLPFDVNFRQQFGDDASAITDHVQAYRPHRIDLDKKELIFTGVFPEIKAGEAYVIVVKKGSVSLTGKNVTVVATPAEADKVMSAADTEKQIGEWKGTFKSMDSKETMDGKFYIQQKNGTYRCLLKEYAGWKSAPFIGCFIPLQALANDRYTIRYVPTSQGDGDEEGDVTAFPTDLYDNDNEFGDDETGITTVKGEGGMVNGSYFDLQGRRIEGKPTKGMYIKNGKKVIIK